MFRKRNFALAMLVITMIALFIALPASARSAGGSPPEGPKSGVAWFDSGWTETTYDSHGKAIGAPRHGDGTNQPYAAQLSAADKGIGVAHIPDSGSQPSNSKRTLSHALTVSGCKSVDWYESGHSAIFGSLLYRFHQVDYWCWSYPNITSLSIYTYISNVDGSQQYRGVISSSDYYYSWSGGSRGGHYSFKQAKFDNCVLKYGCIGSSYPWTKVWLNGNGAWAADDGGGA